MGIYIFVVISHWEFAVLTVKAVSAQVVMSRWTDAVSSPVTEGADDLIRVNSAALSHSHMMRRIKTGSSDITYCTAEMYYLFSIFFHCILCSQSITVIFYQPQIVFITECFYSPQVKWVS